MVDDAFINTSKKESCVSFPLRRIVKEESKVHEQMKRKETFEKFTFVDMMKSITHKW